MLNLDCHILAQVVSKAIADAADHPRWIKAIQRACLELDSNPYIARGELHGLVIGSPSGNVYSANGTCQCEAYLRGHACWHRAAARIVRLHDETQQHRELAAAARARQADAPELNSAPVQLHQPQIVCEQPDNLCSVHAPCAAHAAQAAAYLAAELVDEQGRALVEPNAQRIARKIAAARATAQLNDLFA